MQSLYHRYIIEKFAGTRGYGTVERETVELVERENLPMIRPVPVWRCSPVYGIM